MISNCFKIRHTVIVTVTETNVINKKLEITHNSMFTIELHPVNCKVF